VHYGVQSIEEKIGTKEFWRVRIGVDNREPENRVQGETYVLQNFTLDELVKLEEVIAKVIKELESMVQANRK
jgi:peptidyl-tRNA hydrolase